MQAVDGWDHFKSKWGDLWVPAIPCCVPFAALTRVILGSNHFGSGVAKLLVLQPRTYGCLVVASSLSNPWGVDNDSGLMEA